MVLFDSDQSAQDAKEALDGQDLGGRKAFLKDCTHHDFKNALNGSGGQGSSGGDGGEDFRGKGNNGGYQKNRKDDGFGGYQSQQDRGGQNSQDTYG